MISSLSINSLANEIRENGHVPAAIYSRNDTLISDDVRRGGGVETGLVRGVGAGGAVASGVEFPPHDRKDNAATKSERRATDRIRGLFISIDTDSPSKHETLPAGFPS